MIHLSREGTFPLHLLHNPFSSGGAGGGEAATLAAALAPAFAPALAALALAALGAMAPAQGSRPIGARGAPSGEVSGVAVRFVDG